MHQTSLSEMKQYFDGSIQNGRIKLKNPQIFNQLVASFKHGAEIRLTLDKKTNLRTENQNRYYWAVPVNILADHFGYFTDDMHEALRLMFLKKETKPFISIRSTTSLSTVEFEDYLEKIRTWAKVNHDVHIPLPNEIDFEI